MKNKVNVNFSTTVVELNLLIDYNVHNQLYIDLIQHLIQLMRLCPSGQSLNTSLNDINIQRLLITYYVFMWQLAERSKRAHNKMVSTPPHAIMQTTAPLVRA